MQQVSEDPSDALRIGRSTFDPPQIPATRSGPISLRKMFDHEELKGVVAARLPISARMRSGEGGRDAYS